jgi:hypothetical protein
MIALNKDHLSMNLKVLFGLVWFGLVWFGLVIDLSYFFLKMEGNSEN